MGKAKRPPAVKNIALLLGLSGEPGRDLLHGVSAAARRLRCPWTLRAVGTHAVSELMSILEGGIDGVIAIDCPEAGPLRAVSAPLVFIGAGAPWLAERRGPLAFAHFDEEAIGRTGASYLRSLGRFRSFAFACTPGFGYPAVRFEGFRKHIASHGHDVFRWPGADGAADDESLVRWLRALPRPAAVMAACDNLAARIVQVATGAGIKIPQDVALLGADNDELLCETVNPPIASVALDHEKLGEQAALALRRLLARPDEPPFTVLSSIRGVIERASARPLAPAAALAERAAAFIRQNASKGIRAADVAAHLGVSRSLADLRLRQVVGESALGMILRLRLDAVAEKLRTTDLTVGQAAVACGFGDLSHAGRLFRRRFGCSMREWRRRSREA